MEISMKLRINKLCVEVKSGQPFEVSLSEDKVLHLSQACLGEIKSNKTNESVCLHINIENKKLVLGTLNSERLPQQIFDLVIDKDFQLSHNWKNGSVYFYGYQADQPFEDDSYPLFKDTYVSLTELLLCCVITDSEGSDSDEEELPRVPIANGKKEAKKEDKPVVVKKEDKPVTVKKEDDSVAAKKKDGKQKVKIVEPEKDDEDDSDSDDSDSMSEDSDSDEDDEDSSDGDDSGDAEEETPKKEQYGKKRPNESALKTPVSDKKAKMSTPQKTDGKKAGGHVATPHPSKSNKQVKSETKSNQKSPASASTDGAHSCKPCNRNFKSDGALQSHNQAKHKASQKLNLNRYSDLVGFPAGGGICEMEASVVWIFGWKRIACCERKEIETACYMAPSFHFYDANALSYNLIS
ncbi:hypothetical protein L1987_84368 [Smallanthus sonchifolius]|uniref:Uncharacterized protein n=1 Tax=Smallanthus sonchifolius TaxID=185202 RepID=A0ACB8YF58_9ASTR|nr:hypothetical protein L1987_84368 [Smallanthus sonchifolius]